MCYNLTVQLDNFCLRAVWLEYGRSEYDRFVSNICPFKLCWHCLSFLRNGKAALSGLPFRYETQNFIR